MTNQFHSIFLGQTGVLRVAAELCARSIVPNIPLVDIGYDLITEKGIRIQVKSSRLLTNRNRYSQPIYAFALPQKITRGRDRVDGSRSYETKPRHFSSVCEFLVLWGQEQDRFWIVPAKMLDGRATIWLGGKARWKEVDLTALKQARSEGLTYSQIAEKFGLDDTLVWQRLTGHEAPKREHGKLTKEVNACENRWDLIESFGNISVASLEREYAKVEASEPDLIVGPKDKIDALKQMYPENP